MANTLNNVLTPKQQMIMRELLTNDWFIAILHGAKRTGKTVFNNYMFLMELARVRRIADEDGVDNPMYILAGFSMSNIQDNILTELSNMLGLTFKFDRYGAFVFNGVRVVQATHGNISGVGRIRGMTAYGAYINEASLAREEVFDEIKTRCSGRGARILVDTNPDNPEHWLKKNYIDSDNPMIREYRFVLDDNTFLDERYKEQMKAQASGMFYDRNVLGLWVSGKGVVYPDYDKRLHMVDSVDLRDFTEFFCGVDWGYEHWGSIVVLGKHIDGRIYLVREYSAQHKEIDYWVDIAHRVENEFGRGIVFWCDSARPEHVGRFQRERLNARNANKSVLSGIESVATLIKSDKFRVVSSGVDKFNEEIYQYVWNEKTGQPIKEHDDILDALRYAVYNQLENKPTLHAYSNTLF